MRLSAVLNGSEQKWNADFKAAAREELQTFYDHAAHERSEWQISKERFQMLREMFDGSSVIQEIASGFDTRINVLTEIMETVAARLLSYE